MIYPFNRVGYLQYLYIMDMFIFLLIFGLIAAAGLINAVYQDYKRYNNAWTFRAVIGYFLLGGTLAFIAVTIVLTLRHGRMSNFVLSQF